MSRMCMRKMGKASLPKNSYVSSNIVDNTNTMASMPSHIQYDTIVMVAFRDGNATPPTLPAGWLSLGTEAGTTCSATLGFKYAASNSETSGTWTNATGLMCYVIRGGGLLSVGAAQQASSATVNYPALVLTNTHGGSWVVGFGMHRSINASMATPPTGMVNRFALEGTLSDMAIHDTNGGVTSWASTNVVTTETASGYIGITLEITDPSYVIGQLNASGKVPVGCNAKFTALGGGASGGGGTARTGTHSGSNFSGNGGGAGGGGAYAKEILVPYADMGTTWSAVAAAAVAGVTTSANGNDGNSTLFTSGSVSVGAEGGNKGMSSSASGPQNTNGGTGGLPILGGYSCAASENGGAGGNGGNQSNTTSGGGANTTHAGAGGGGGGCNITSAFAGGKGGNSGTVTGGAGGSNSGGVGGAPAASAHGEGGGGSGGGGGSSSFGGTAGASGIGGSYGGGSGGGGGKEGSTGNAAASAASSPGDFILEWVAA